MLLRCISVGPLTSVESVATEVDFQELRGAEISAAKKTEMARFHVEMIVLTYPKLVFAV